MKPVERSPRSSRAEQSVSQEPASAKRVLSPRASSRVRLVHAKQSPQATLEIHFVEWGLPSGPPLVLLHGGSAHARWWDFVAAELSPAHRVIALDLRGHGDSSRVEPASYLVEDYVADLEAFVAELRLGPFVLVGHSLGGYVALSFAAGSAASELRGVVAVDTRPFVGDGNNDFWARLRGLAHPRYRDLDDVCRRFRPIPRGTRARPEVISHVATLGVRTTHDGYLEPKFHRPALGPLPYADLTPRLERIECPVLLARGAESAFVTPEMTRRMAERCRSATIVEIEQAEHHVLLDQPQALARVITRFADEVFNSRQ